MPEVVVNTRNVTPHAAVRDQFNGEMKIKFRFSSENGGWKSFLIHASERLGAAKGSKLVILPAKDSGVFCVPASLEREASGPAACVDRPLHLP